MKTEKIANLCPKCQAPLPANAPQGLCPKCLLAAAATPTEAGQPAHDKPGEYFAEHQSAPASIKRNERWAVRNTV
jgi:predicted amidophosphoribosyltransferase